MADRLTFTVLSLFPEIVESFFNTSIMARAVNDAKIAYDLVQIRDFADDKHHTCDDATYGGGAGMVLMPHPLSRALDSIHAREKRTIYVTPSGIPFSQEYAKELSKERELVLICGRYEGIDQRIIDTFVDDEISIGDYILSSGEVAALAIIDSVYRLIAGVINQESLKEESFYDGLLEYPQYTRPAEFNGLKVPEVLLNGHHEEIRKWRLKESIRKTMRNRPDLLTKQMGNEEIREIAEILRNEIKG